MSQKLYPMFPVLVVDDERTFLSSVETTLLTNGISNVECCQDSRKVMDLLEEKEFSLILLDIIMPYISGEKLFKQIDEKYPHIPIIILTAVEEIKDIFRKMKAESFDYLVKTTEPDKIIKKICHAINYHEEFPEIVTKSKKMFVIFKKIRTLSNTSTEVLITGEAGAGKELVAHAIHRISSQNGNFIKMNFSSKDDPSSLKKFYNHKKAIIKDVYIDREGKIQLAEKGTLFIDEIGFLSKELQDKLLRLVKDKMYYPIGSETTMLTTARIVLSTKCDLKNMMEVETFHEELYYHLHEHQIHVPALRDRKEDIACLVAHFIEKESKKYGENIPKATNGTIEILSDYNYPGNIRELKNIIYRVVSTYHDLPELPPELFLKEILSTKKKNKKIKFGKFVNKSVEWWRKINGT
jgi:DNA-binding NtrC family response regulator